MFVVGVGAVVTTVEFVRTLVDNGMAGDRFFAAAVSLWLWFTVLFANFAEAMAEGRGKAQADTLRKGRTQTQAKRLTPREGEGAKPYDILDYEMVRGQTLRRGDHVICTPGDIIAGDGEVVEGVASVDESAITGESAPVVRE